MWRLYLNSQRKFEFAFVERNGRYIAGSKQGYENKSDAVKQLRKICKNSYQDESGEEMVKYYYIPVYNKWFNDGNWVTFKPYKPIRKQKKSPQQEFNC